MLETKLQEDDDYIFLYRGGISRKLIDLPFLNRDKLDFEELNNLIDNYLVEKDNTSSILIRQIENMSDISKVLFIHKSYHFIFKRSDMYRHEDPFISFTPEIDVSVAFSRSLRFEMKYNLEKEFDNVISYFNFIKNRLNVGTNYFLLLLNNNKERFVKINIHKNMDSSLNLVMRIKVNKKHISEDLDELLKNNDIFFYKYSESLGNYSLKDDNLVICNVTKNEYIQEDEYTYIGTLSNLKNLISNIDFIFIKVNDANRLRNRYFSRI